MKPTIIGGPSGSLLIVGETIILNCTAATEGGAPSSFEWYLGLIKLNSTGTMGERYEKEVTLSGVGAYKCLAKNDDGEAESDELVLTVEGK
jgi:hypothetical protein